MHPMLSRERAPGMRTPRLVDASDDIDNPRLVNIEIGALHEQLKAMRLDLIHGVIPRAERITLTRGDLDYMLVQLDAAIAAAGDIVATRCGPSNRADTAGRTRGS